MSEKSYLNILRGGVFSSFVILFFVFSSMLFPFISSKQLSFNILIEVLLVLLLVFLIKYPKYFPKKSYLTWGLVAFFITMFFSLFVSVDFNLSFWGDIERMLGFFHLLHFLAFYFIIITVFRSKKDYYNLLYVLTGSAVLVALYGIIKDSPESSIGNRAYVAAIMLFAFFLQALFFLKTKNWWLRLVYVAGIIISGVSFIRADISGSHVGLVAGIFVVILTLVIASGSKKVKIISGSALVVFVLLIATLFSLRSHSSLENNYLGKALRDFSSDNVTLNTRLISYRAAGHYLVDHPVSMIFGVGHGNYALIFDKYFDSKFYDFDRSQTYFDRAHNNLIDILTTTGILGLLAYLSIFVFILIYLIRAYKYSFKSERGKGIDRIELALLLGLLSAYFVQNLAVFDSFATYLYFIALLAFINFLGLDRDAEPETGNKDGRKIFKNFIVPVIIIISIFSLVNNINAFSMIRKTIAAYSFSYRQGIIEGSKKYQEVFEYNTGLEVDVRDSFITLILGNSDEIMKSDDIAGSKNALQLAIEAGEKNLSHNIYDSLTLFRLHRVYDLAGRFYFSKGYQEEASQYSSLSLSYLDRAIESSPGRVPLYLNKANLLLNFGERENAIEVIEYAKNLNLKMPEAYCQLSHFYFVADNHQLFIENFESCGSLGGFSLMNWGDFMASVESGYYNNGRSEELKDFYETVLMFEADNVEALSKLALLYYELDELDLARETALRLLENDPELYQRDVAAFLEKVDEKSLD